MSKSSGRRGRARGKSAYARKGKSGAADFYGEWRDGRRLVPEKIRAWAQPAAAQPATAKDGAR